ncbi:hypothetical protein FZI02_20845 [Cronobacter sakazakii]|mgnify:CR=1 FL=1|nr:hypothetical protein [Cronobacter sakazakii]EJG0748353.1 hypothetical protein [Cronobacter sakazakii]KAB0835354.1 hypothetical protein FZI02_20845 [Cronobacter sakazakii]KAB0837808.1 hypothetical protein FZI45_19855 [Cronobacter sakazakii]
MKKYIYAIIFAPVMASAGNLSDFFKANPDLDNNIAIHTAISKTSRFEAAGYARREGGDEDELMASKGDQFAILGFRRLKNSCQYPDAASMLGLNERDCKIVLSKDI